MFEKHWFKAGLDKPRLYLERITEGAKGTQEREDWEH